MSSAKHDLSVFNRFNFERPPVGVKFLYQKPSRGIEPLDKRISFCEMLKEAHQQELPFYAVEPNFDCIGAALLGMTEFDANYESGQVGPKLGIFKEPRANQRLYHFVPKLDKNTINYVVFSRMDKLPFDPDVLVLTCDTPAQAEILLRASSYSAGKIYVSRLTTVIGCSWLYIYPYLSGELNYFVTGLCAGMKARQVFPDGLILVSIPYDLLTTMLLNLLEMDWKPPLYAVGDREKFLEIRKQIAAELNQEH